MTDFSTAHLQECIAHHRERIPALASLADSVHGASLPTLIELYEQCYPWLEQAMWSSDKDFDVLLHCYQSLFREQEALIGKQPADDRYHFILSIPVADRPAHLRTCLDSILQLCETFAYGGKPSAMYRKVKVIVAEDSRDDNHIQQHIELVNEYRGKGLQVFHFGQAEQYDMLHALPDNAVDRLGNLLTTLPRDRFFLKGQAANRNLSYLKCLQLTEDKDRTLYYLVDSDQSFCVNRQTESGEESVFAVNYFHAIDRIFRTTDTLMLTGKLVGDPPVSPAVMASNFLDDVIGFFQSLAQMDPSAACAFHARPAENPADAAYHDMAGLFGFADKPSIYPYRCRLHGEHDHNTCLNDFAARLNTFFFGEHLTRKTVFNYPPGFQALAPARTIYPGNYIVNYSGLKYIIPFGHLRLRMSGPTAGRLIEAEIGHRFASANLPHLHRRTSAAGLQDEFRPGVELAAGQELQNIDLSNEFERQFFGDLMLFSSQELVKLAEVNQPFPQRRVIDIIERKEQELLSLYRQKHRAILEKNRQLNELVFAGNHWWLDWAGENETLPHIQAFIDNIELNFGERSQAWKQIQSARHRAGRRQQLVDALVNYRAERDAWDSLFD